AGHEGWEGPAAGPEEGSRVGVAGIVRGRPAECGAGAGARPDAGPRAGDVPGQGEGGAEETSADWREREHDDLVLAVALAAWVAEQIAQAPPVEDDLPITILWT